MFQLILPGIRNWIFNHFGFIVNPTINGNQFTNPPINAKTAPNLSKVIFMQKQKLIVPFVPVKQHPKKSLIRQLLLSPLLG
jgi:hypothetical protein